MLPLQRATLRLLGDVRVYALQLENKILSSAAAGPGSQKVSVGARLQAVLILLAGLEADVGASSGGAACAP
jgi:hypothetical protein